MAKTERGQRGGREGGVRLHTLEWQKAGEWHNNTVQGKSKPRGRSRGRSLQRTHPSRAPPQPLPAPCTEWYNLLFFHARCAHMHTLKPSSPPPSHPCARTSIKSTRSSPLSVFQSQSRQTRVRPLSFGNARTRSTTLSTMSSSGGPISLIWWDGEGSCVTKGDAAGMGAA